MPRSWLCGSIVLLALASCGDDDNGSPHEDAGYDAGSSAPDAGRDAGDAGRDAGRDAGPDAASDSGTPATDAGGMDAASDAATSDTGTPSTDSGNLDASELDATASDAGESDASQSDASGELDASESDAAAEDSGATTDAGSDAGRTVTFDEIYTDIISLRCAGCHVAGHRSGLDLSSEAVAYADLVGVDAGEGETGAGSACDQTDLKRVVARDADSSLLVLKIEPDPPCGGQMPLPGSGRTFLTAEEAARIRAWIDQGAAAPTSD